MKREITYYGVPISQLPKEKLIEAIEHWSDREQQFEDIHKKRLELSEGKVRRLESSLLVCERLLIISGIVLLLALIF